MYKEYAIVCQNKDTKRVFMEKMMGINEADARKSLREVYRYCNYKVLTTVEIPDIEIPE